MLSHTNEQGAPIVVIMGPPGSGKGTQGDLLEHNGVLKKVSTGDILRSHVKRGTDLGKKVSAIIDAGKFVSDEILAELVECELNSLAKTPVLLDGYPRNEKQAKNFGQSKAFSRLIKVIFLSVSKDFLVKRLLGRLVCSSCGATFHLKSFPPKVTGVCDICSGSLVSRNDDTKDVVERRLTVYENETEPLLNYYNELGLLETVDGRSDPKEVYTEIMSKINKITKNQRSIG